MTNRLWWWIGGMAGLTTLSFGALQYWKWQAFGYNALDLSIYTQTIWSLAHGYGFASSIHDPSYLGDHLELGLVPISWLYRLWPFGLTVLWAQTVLLVSSIFPLALLARRYLGQRGAIITSAFFLLHPLLFNVALYEFHGLIFVLPLTLWAIVAYQRHRLGWWLVLLGLTALVREDMPLLVLGWAAFAAVQRRSWRWWLPPILIGVGWFLAAQEIIRQAQPIGSYKYLAFYRWLGANYGEMATFPFRHPLIFLSHVFQSNNWLLAMGLLLGFGFLPLLAGEFLIPVTLPFIQLLLLGSDPVAVLKLHYVLPFLPFLLWATLIAIKKIRDGRVWPRRDQSLLRIGASIVLIAGWLYADLLVGPLVWPWSGRPDVGTSPAPILQAAVEKISPTDRVMSTFALLPALTNRPAVYSLNYLHLGRRQYSEIPYHLPTAIDSALIDWQQYYQYQYLYRDTLFQGQTGIKRLADALSENNLKLSRWVDSVALYTRDGRDTYQPTELISDQPLLPPSKTIQSLGQPRLTRLKNQPLPTNQWQEVEVALLWQAGEPAKHPLSIRFTATRNGAVVWSSTRILGQGLQPAEAWVADTLQRTRYRLAFPPNLAGSVDLRATVVEFDGRMRLDRWQTFVPIVSQADSLTTVPLGTISL